MKVKDGNWITIKEPKFSISISQASSRKMANSCSLAPGLLLWATQPSGSSGSFKLFKHVNEFCNHHYQSKMNEEVSLVILDRTVNTKVFYCI